MIVRSRTAKTVVLAGLGAVLVIGVPLALGAPPTGTLDRSFGHHGVVATLLAPGTDSAANAVAVQHDGKIVIAGSAGNWIGVARFTPRGHLDSTFGQDGKAIVKAGVGAHGNALALQRDGKIVVAGGALVGDKHQPEAVLVRLNTDGSLDTTFGSGLGDKGIVLDTFGSSVAEATAVAIQPNGKFVVGGYRTDLRGQSPEYAVARYTAAGTTDPSFGGGGVASGTFRGYLSVGTSIALTPAGRIVVGGTAGSVTSGSFRYRGFGLARLTSKGSVDSSFGLGGSRVVGIHGGGELLAMELRKGKIVAAGATTPNMNFAVMRLRANGKRDRSFGRGGVVTTHVGREGSATAVVVLGGGKTVAVGAADRGRHANQQAVVVRYRRNGSLDEAFGRHGIAQPLSAITSGETSAALERGRLIVAGWALRGEREHFKAIVARYLNR